MDETLLGTLIDDRYHLTDILGQGGMGIVFKAEDMRLNNRLCAIKLLKGATNDPNESKRFEAELQIISRLRSPHVVQVLDTGYLPGPRLYIVMELLEGDALSDVLKNEGALALPRAIHLTKGILAGLSEAHEFGVVHRDLKPANIFITRSRAGDEQAKVLDFGIAKDTTSDEGTGLTSASMIIGTPKYMAPEQFMKQPTDPRTDIYAVGLLLYQMISGDPPFVANSSLLPENMAQMPQEFRVGWLHLNAKPEPLNLPEPLWNLIDKMLSKDQETRPTSTTDVIQTLNHVAMMIGGMTGQFMALGSPGMTPAQGLTPPTEGSGPISGPYPVQVNGTPNTIQGLANEAEPDPSGETTGAPIMTELSPSSVEKKSGILRWVVLAAIIGCIVLAAVSLNPSVTPNDPPSTKALVVAPPQATPETKPKEEKVEPKTCNHTLMLNPARGVKVYRVQSDKEEALGKVSGFYEIKDRPCAEEWIFRFKRRGYSDFDFIAKGTETKARATVKLKKPKRKPWKVRMREKELQKKRNKVSSKKDSTDTKALDF